MEIIDGMENNEFQNPQLTQVIDTIKKMPEETILALTYRYMFGDTFKGISRSLNMPQCEIRNQLNLAESKIISIFDEKEMNNVIEENIREVINILINEEISRLDKEISHIVLSEPSERHKKRMQRLFWLSDKPFLLRIYTVINKIFYR